MASKRAVAVALALLHEAFPTRDVSDVTASVWYQLFADTSDDDLLVAVKACARQMGRKFFPTPGEIAFFLPRHEPRECSAADTLRRIEALGSYNPHTGWQWPRVETVRVALGDAVAAAYGYVGPTRLASEHATTREIAERDFAVALDDERTDLQHRPPQLPASHAEISRPVRALGAAPADLPERTRDGDRPDDPPDGHA